jgi:hypothetical protein
MRDCVFIEDTYQTKWTQTMKTQWHKPLIHITQTAMLVAMQSLGVGSNAWAQDTSTQSAVELQIKANEMGRQTFKRKNGQVIQYEEIRVLSKKEKEVIFDDEMTELEFKTYSNWQEQKIAVRTARNAELDKTNAAAWQEYEKNAQKLEATVRTALASGLKLPSDYKRTFSFAIAHGKPLETVKYFESLLARPELFKN